MRKGIQPATMPMMTLASTAIDLVAVDPAPVHATCLSFLPTDSALFFTDEEDRLLLQLQEEHYSPSIQWMESVIGSPLTRGRGLRGKIPHSPATHARIKGIVERLEPFALTCLQAATMESKSLILALTLVARARSLQQIIAASRVEEEFQIGIWGVVEGGHDMDRLNNAVTLSSVDTFLRLLWTPEQHAAFLLGQIMSPK